MFCCFAARCKAPFYLNNRYYMGLPVLPDAVQDMLKMRLNIGQVCKWRTGDDTILPDSVQLPAPCVSRSSCSPIVLRKHEKKRKRETGGSQMSAPQSEVPVHKVAMTLFHVGFLWKPTSVCASRISKIGCMGITRSMLVILENWLGLWTRTLS